jgi:hypothetical protein
MQRFSMNSCQPAMGKILLCFALLCFFAGCKKDGDRWIEAVVEQPGCAANSWIVSIENPNSSKQGFLCDQDEAMLSSFIPNCGASAVILNLPSSFASPGKKIRFSIWEDKGQGCFPGNRAAHHIEVTDIRPR